ncbi:alpha/beta fold hydrolase [Neolewinella antarctica]|uniref:Pimeloyl-ACP methyl ester carboxylesterase n=1 Tax=Neolewinella antarctica TaxID=442734 RepID=A0ABX0X912_9BACT|nr:alpha/beta hydrolase [Neolewinella antarctica]NJC25756.1 pimeloyl-ACP methyl ester carboxylesterase [Neolewinella antarctica]
MKRRPSGASGYDFCGRWITLAVPGRLLFHISYYPIDFFLTTEGREALDAPITKNRLFVRQYGRGGKIMISLHGFGRNGRRMERLALALGDHFTTFAPDLPFHGKSEWVDQRYRPRQIGTMFNQLLKEYPNREVYLLGHSLGGRVLSNVLPFLDHTKIMDLALVAPDGAGGRYTNWIDTLPSALVKPLAMLSERPRGVVKLSNWLRKRGVINKYSAEYLEYNLKDGTFRRRLAGSLRSVLLFPPSPEELEDTLTNRSITATVFTGDRDPLLDLNRLSALYGPLPSVNVVTYSGSHWLPEQLLRDYYLRRGN